MNKFDSDSDDDMPLAMAKPNGKLSDARISKADDKAIDQSNTSKPLPAGVSIRNGPVTDTMNVDKPANGKRSRTSGAKVVYKDASDDSEDDVPLQKRQKTSAKSKHIGSDSDSDVPIAKKTSKLPPKATKADMGESSNDDEPLIQNIAKTKQRIEKKAAKQSEALQKKPTPKKRAKAESDSNATPKKAKRKSNGTSAKRTVVKDESDDDVPLAKKVPVKIANGKAKAAPTPVKKGKGVKKEDSEGEGEGDEEEEYRWWDAPKKEDDSIKWETLEHNGVIFPPPYEPLPKNVKLKYDGKPVNLPIEAEEVAGFFGAMLNSTHNVENPTFQKNFFGDFTEILKKHGGATDRDGNKVSVKEFSKLDFQSIFEYYSARNEERKARTTAEKKADKADRDELEAPYMHCKWDGRKEKVGNMRVEPPGLFRGRGEHPKTGRVKARVLPEQITINIGENAMVPTPPEGHKWKEVRHDNRATWLAMWQENINNAYKYVMLAANSTVKGQSDYKKFEKARMLKKYIGKIRKDYTKELKSELMADRQRATAVYLIDKFALRAGNEKDADNEAETVGCCSLKYEHVTLKPPNIVIFDFLGKDSIRFYDEVTVDVQVFKNLKLFKKAPKVDGDDIFDRLNTAQLNKHLTNYMPGLTAKVFRTYNASFTMSTLLQELKPENISMAEKIKLYNDCNRKVAILCNHKRTVGAGHEAQMEKIGDRMKGMKYQQWRTKQMILDIDPKMKKKLGADYFALDEELEESWIVEHIDFLVKEQRTKIEKKFQKDNEKLVAEGQKEMKAKELTERLEVTDELEKKLKKENKTKKVEAEGRGPTVEKLQAAVKKIDERLDVMKLQAEDREGNKEVALGTSKINYIDPRLTVVFAKKFNVPIEKFFSKTLREKFNWAIKSVEDSDDWEF